MHSIFSKANVIRKLAYKVKYIHQIKRFNVFFGDLRIGFLKNCCLDCEQKKESIQEKEHNQEFSIQSFTITFILFKCPTSNGNSTDFHLFILSWKGSW